MSTSTTALLPRIESRIQMIRGQRLMIDVDLAQLYGVQTKRRNEQVKRNRERFPSGSLFQLTIDEKTEVVANCDHLQILKFSKTRRLRLPRILSTPSAKLSWSHTVAILVPRKILTRIG